MKRIALAFLVGFLAAWFSPVSDVASSYLSIFCFLVAACMFAYWIYALRQLRRGLREDQEIDRPFARERPGWMARKTNKNRP